MAGMRQISDMGPIVAAGLRPREPKGRRPSLQLELDLFRDAEGVINLDPEVAHRAVQLRMPEQQLHGSQIAGPFVNLSRPRSPHRVRAVR